MKERAELRCAPLRVPSEIKRSVLSLLCHLTDLTYARCQTVLSSVLLRVIFLSSTTAHLAFYIVALASHERVVRTLIDDLHICNYDGYVQPGQSACKKMLSTDFQIVACLYYGF